METRSSVILSTEYLTVYCSEDPLNECNFSRMSHFRPIFDIEVNKHPILSGHIDSVDLIPMVLIPMDALVWIVMEPYDSFMEADYSNSQLG